VTFRIDHRPRRNRQTASIRSMVRETRLHPSDFILPLFLVDGQEIVCEGSGNGPVHALDNAIRTNVDKVGKYSKYLKGMPLIGNMIVAFILGLSFLFCGAAFNNMSRK